MQYIVGGSSCRTVSTEAYISTCVSALIEDFCCKGRADNAWRLGRLGENNHLQGKYIEAVVVLLAFGFGLKRYEF